MVLTLRYRAVGAVPVEAPCLAPDQLAGKALRAIAALPLQHGNQRTTVGELFEIHGNADDGEVVIEGDCAGVKYLGSRMSAGQLMIRGRAGDHVGAQMTGGTIDVAGEAGDWTGAHLAGGTIRVQGNLGDFVGSAYPGMRHGMRGGSILVSGSVGRESGKAMRRGLIAVGADAGDGTGMSMIAGTILVFGQSAAWPGPGLKRGTIALFGALPALLPGYRYACRYRPVFMNLYLGILRAHGFSIRDDLLGGCFDRYAGDLAGLGKGELLHWQAR